MKGNLKADKKTKFPVIIGTSAGEIDYLGLEEAVSLVNISREKYGVEAFLNLDHNNNMKLIKKAPWLNKGAFFLTSFSKTFEFFRKSLAGLIVYKSIKKSGIFK